MPKFTVTVLRKEEFSTDIDIEAEDEDEAISKAEGKVRDLSAGIIETDSLDWEHQEQTFEAEEVSENNG